MSANDTLNTHQTCFNLKKKSAVEVEIEETTIEREGKPLLRKSRRRPIKIRK
jgi:hypothetical protein